MMTEAAAVWVVRLATAYLALGLAFAIPFVLVGVGRIDPVARTGSAGFRILILPGVAALWPLFLYRWTVGHSTPPEERTAHRRAARSRAAGAP